jgi:hypothetical protein
MSGDREKRLAQLEAAVSGVVAAAEMTMFEKSRRVAFLVACTAQPAAHTNHVAAGRRIAELLAAGMRPQPVSTFWL